MKVLIIDTSSDAVCVAVGDSKESATDILMDEKARHGENLFETLADALKEQGISIKSIEAVGVGIGPGSFTGLRIGIIAAHSLAHALAVPVVYFSSLELLALSQVQPAEGAYPQEEVSVYRDARRKEIYTATFSFESLAIHEEVVDGVKIASMLTRVESEHLIPYSHPEEPQATKDLLKPSAAIALVQKAVENNIIADTFSAQAIYIRKSDAELSWNVKS